MSEQFQCGDCSGGDSRPLAPPLTHEVVAKELWQLNLFASWNLAEEPIFVGRPVFPGAKIFSASLEEHITARNAKACAKQILAGECPKYCYGPVEGEDKVELRLIEGEHGE